MSEGMRKYNNRYYSTKSPTRKLLRSLIVLAPVGPLHHRSDTKSMGRRFWWFCRFFSHFYVPAPVSCCTVLRGSAMLPTAPRARTSGSTSASDRTLIKMAGSTCARMRAKLRAMDYSGVAAPARCAAMIAATVSAKKNPNTIRLRSGKRARFFVRKFLASRNTENLGGVLN
jgi:hypothetical protein